MKIVFQMLATLTIIGLLSGGLLSYISGWSSPFIAKNKLKATEEAIYLVQPEGKSYEPVKDPSLEAYKVFNENKDFIGYSLVYKGNGFQDKIRVMAGLTEDIKKITAIEVLEQTETPGLGTKILENNFRDQFHGLITTPNIGWIKEGSGEKKENEIVAITGATISSKSVVAILNEGLIKLRELEKKGGDK
ncbi:MAG TPA: FMN-binding protein [Ignavibacteriaceae bacterium]|jgi:electron transport complex protein RnfG|nr:FMN-binding protein [Ignavibacteriaceae bacterium]